MAARTRTPNEALARLLAEAGVGNAQLARRVNAVGAELGVTTHYDKTAVSHWLAGSVPKPEVRPAVAEALSRLLRRPVTLAELGWAPRGAAGGGGGADAVGEVADLSRADMDPSRRSVLGAGMYVAALGVPRFEDLADRAEAVAAGRTVRIGTSDVETVRLMTEKIADILDEIGAGHARPMAAAFLTNTVTPYLRAEGPEQVRKGMLAAASDLVYLTGWMAMFEERQGLGQRYYHQALALAGSAQDHVTYCRTLRGMSLQASHLGYGPKALELANAAAEAAPASGPRLVAFLRGQQAAAASMTGDRRTALARLRETEAALSRADDRRDAVGGYDQAAFHFHEAHVMWWIGDREGSVNALRRSNHARSPQERQGRLHALGVIADRQMQMRHIEAATQTWAEFLDLHATLSSTRGDEHMKALQKGMAGYRRVPGVGDLLARATDVAQRKAA
ncbi:hypothetical protein HYE82_33210 [Streptomyces sp. BR123]|uniref:hypothetical protein n=1 Tax=Streptomyces sp. BR123 TaxID=2749828 RepID=UPI0015C42CD9|nr:hypothetical protein [Streptomyces sp. BR123]NXY99154.1 hypothetical protein [Streptomyces sp. BR123]